METVVHENKKWNVEYIPAYDIHVCKSEDDRWYTQIKSSWYEFGPKKKISVIINENKKGALREICQIFKESCRPHEEKNLREVEIIHLKTYNDHNYVFVFDNTGNLYLRFRKRHGHDYYYCNCHGNWFIRDCDSQWQPVDMTEQGHLEEIFERTGPKKTSIFYQSWQCKTLLTDGFVCTSSRILQYLRNLRGEWGVTTGLFISKHISIDVRNMIETIYLCVTDQLRRSGRELQSLESEVDMTMSQYIFEFLYDVTLKSSEESGVMKRRVSNETKESLRKRLKSKSEDTNYKQKDYEEAECCNDHSSDVCETLDKNGDIMQSSMPSEIITLQKGEGNDNKENNYNASETMSRDVSYDILETPSVNRDNKTMFTGEPSGNACQNVGDKYRSNINTFEHRTSGEKRENTGCTRLVTENNTTETEKTCIFLEDSGTDIYKITCKNSSTESAKTRDRSSTKLDKSRDTSREVTQFTQVEQYTSNNKTIQEKCVENGKRSTAENVAEEQRETTVNIHNSSHVQKQQHTRKNNRQSACTTLEDSINDITVSANSVSARHSLNASVDLPPNRETKKDQHTGSSMNEEEHKPCSSEQYDEEKFLQCQPVHASVFTGNVDKDNTRTGETSSSKSVAVASYQGDSNHVALKNSRKLDKDECGDTKLGHSLIENALELGEKTEGNQLDKYDMDRKGELKDKLPAESTNKEEPRTNINSSEQTGVEELPAESVTSLSKRMMKEEQTAAEINLVNDVTSNQNVPSHASKKSSVKDQGGWKDTILVDQENKKPESNVPVKPLHERKEYLDSMLFVIKLKLKEHYRKHFNWVSSINWLKDGQCFSFGFKRDCESHAIGFQGFCKLNSKHNLLWGNSSFGKSTLSALIAKNWCEDAALTGFELCFLVSFTKVEQFDNLSDILTDVIHQDIEETSYDKQSLEAVIKYAEDKVLIMCDGLDKLSHKDNSTLLRSISESSFLEKSKIILTSRPTAIDENNLKSFDVFEIGCFDYKRCRHFTKAHCKTFNEKQFTKFWENSKAFYLTYFPPRYLYYVFQCYSEQKPFRYSLYNLLHEIMTTRGRECGFESNDIHRMFCALGRLCLKILKLNTASITREALEYALGKDLLLVKKLDVFTEPVGRFKSNDEFNCNKHFVVFFATLFLRHKLLENSQQAIEYLCPDGSIADYVVSDLGNGKKDWYIVGIFPEIAMKVKDRQCQNFEMYHDIKYQIEMSRVFDSTNMLLRVSTKNLHRFGFEELADNDNIQDLFTDVISTFEVDGTIEMKFLRNAYEARFYLVWTVEDSDQEGVILQGVVVKTEANLSTSSAKLCYDKLHLSFFLSKVDKIANVLYKLLQINTTECGEQFSLTNLVRQICTTVENMKKQYFVSLSMTESSGTQQTTLSFDFTNKTSVSARNNLISEICHNTSTFQEPLVEIYLK